MLHRSSMKVSSGTSQLHWLPSEEDGLDVAYYILEDDALKT